MEITDNETVGLKIILIKYLHHWRLFAVVFGISFIFAILYLVLYPTTYEIKATVQLQEDKDMGGASFGLGEAAGLMKSFGLGGGVGSVINMEDELATLKSVSLLKEMVQQLGVNISYTEPYSFYKIYEKTPVVLTLDSAKSETIDESIEFYVKKENNKIVVKTESKRTGKKVFSFNTLPATIDLANIPFILNYTEGGDTVSSFEFNITYTPARWIAEDLSDDLLIEELSKSSNIIELSCLDYEKYRGVDMLNTVIDLYDKQAVDYKKKEALKSIDFLNGRIDSVMTGLSETEQRISSYKQLHKLTAVEADVLFYAEQMKELQVKMIELEAQANVVSLMDKFVKNPDNKYNLVPMLLSATGEKEGGPIATYNELLLERARVIQNSSINNPLVHTLSEQADKLRGSVFKTIENAQSGLQMTLADLKSKEDALFRKMGDYPAQEKDYVELKRQQEISQGIYLILLQKREELLLAVGQDKAKTRIIDSAYVKSKPVGPRKLFAAIGLILLTIIIPVIYLFSKEQISALWRLYKETK